MSARERAEETVTLALRGSTKNGIEEVASDVLDDLGSAGFSVVETWELEALREAAATTEPSGPSGAAREEAAGIDLARVLNRHGYDSRLGFHDYVLAGAALRHLRSLAATRDAERHAKGPRP